MIQTKGKPLQRYLDKAKQYGDVIGVEAAPGGRSHVTALYHADGSVTRSYKIAPIYYYTRWGTWEPLGDVCSRKGNKHIIIRADKVHQIHPFFLERLITRAKIMNGTLEIESPYGSLYDNLSRVNALYEEAALYRPDANPETTTVDGRASEEQESSWAAAQGGPGDSAIDDAVFLQVEVSRRGNGNWDVRRSAFLFDTSDIGSGATISAADITLRTDNQGSQNADNDGNDFVAIVSSNPASNTAIVAGDFDAIGDAIDNPTEMHDVGERLDITGTTNETDYTWTLNSTGIANIAKTGISKFGGREGHDILDDQPNLGAQDRDRMLFHSADEITSGDGSYSPELDVTTGGGGGEAAPLVRHLWW